MDPDRAEDEADRFYDFQKKYGPLRYVSELQLALPQENVFALQHEWDENSTFLVPGTEAKSEIEGDENLGFIIADKPTGDFDLAKDGLIFVYGKYDCLDCEHSGVDVDGNSCPNCEGEGYAGGFVMFGDLIKDLPQSKDENFEALGDFEFYE